MPAFEATIKIERTPAEVRAVVLDWANLSQWHTAFVKSLKPVPETKSPVDVRPGDELLLRVFSSPTLHVKCVQNDAQGLEWAGGPALLFHGSHYVRFEEADGGKATLVHHGETFTGLFGLATGLPLVSGQVQQSYVDFNNDLKKKCESS